MATVNVGDVEQHADLLGYANVSHQTINLSGVQVLGKQNPGGRPHHNPNKYVAGLHVCFPADAGRAEKVVFVKIWARWDGSVVTQQQAKAAAQRWADVAPIGSAVTITDVNVVTGALRTAQDDSELRIFPHYIMSALQYGGLRELDCVKTGLTQVFVEDE